MINIPGAFVLIIIRYFTIMSLYLYLHYDIITYKYTASLLELNNIGEN